MTPCVTLETVRLFVRVDDEIENPTLELMICAATELIETRIHRPVIGEVGKGAVCASIDEVPSSIRLVACMLVGYMYEHRNATDAELRDRCMRSMMLDDFIDWSRTEE